MQGRNSNQSSGSVLAHMKLNGGCGNFQSHRWQVVVPSADDDLSGAHFDGNHLLVSYTHIWVRTEPMPTVL